MSHEDARRTHGWGHVALDTVIAWLLPSVSGAVIRLVAPGEDAAMGGLLAAQLLAFYLIARARGRAGLPAHLAKVAGAMAGLSLALGGFNFPEWAAGVPVLAGCAAIGGWLGARRG